MPPLPHLGDNVCSFPLNQEISEIREGLHFHLMLRVSVLRAHVREEGNVRELEEPRVNLGFVRIDI
jgi:hypothetical protein